MNTNACIQTTDSCIQIKPGIEYVAHDDDNKCHQDHKQRQPRARLAELYAEAVAHSTEAPNTCSTGC